MKTVLKCSTILAFVLAAGGRAAFAQTGCPCNGDVNGIGGITIQDRTIELSCVGCNPCVGACANSDVNCDGTTDYVDVGVVDCQLPIRGMQECCSKPFGACSLPLGHSSSYPDCLITLETACHLVNWGTPGVPGTYAGDGTDCTSVEPPANDACAQRFDIQPGLTPFTTVNATTDGPNPVTGGDCGTAFFSSDVWLQYVPTFSGDVLISLCQDTDYDAILVVYGDHTGTCTCPSDNGGQIACNDEGCTCVPSGGPPRLTVAVEAGECYLIRVAGLSGGDEQGTGSILVEQTFGTIAVCDDDDACTVDSCDPATGCVYTTNCGNGTCDSGCENCCNCPEDCGCGLCGSCNPDTCDCALGDHCGDGTCDSDCGENCTTCASDCPTPPCSSCIDGDITPDCIDGSACTTDTCDPATGCVFTPITCNDFDACTADSCDPATGCFFTPITCVDGDACTDDSCDPASGCVFTPITCNDFDACTADSCNAATGCVNTPITCDDGDACTADSCDPATGCVFTPITCNGGDACTAGSCDPATGCVNTTITCDDFDACTADSCDPATGCNFTPITCDDFDACTADSCNPATGCVYTTITCDDGNACTADSCDPATGCVNTAISCDDGVACTADSCDPATGCVNTTVACDDGDPCTADSCDPTAGCVHTTITCDDGDACTADSCDPMTGCVHTTNCGNGSCDPACENCTTCASDCLTPLCNTCIEGVIASNCGNGTCEPDCGENCGTCPGDCPVTPCEQICVGSVPTPACGDGSCNPACENCSTCASDCPTPPCNTCIAGVITPNCDDGNPCTEDTCRPCAHHDDGDDDDHHGDGDDDDHDGHVAGHGNHGDDDDDVDGNGLTYKCVHRPICTAACCPNCDDGNPCTEDTCALGAGHDDGEDDDHHGGGSNGDDDDDGDGQSCKCRHRRISSCCLSDAGCNDRNPCTRDQCIDHRCVRTPIVPCCGDNSVDAPETCDPPGSRQPNGKRCRSDCTY